MNVAEIKTLAFNLPGIEYTFVINPVTLVTTWAIIAILIVLGFLIGRNIKISPNKVQTAAEFAMGYFITFCKDTLGKDWRNFFSLVMSLFLFVTVSNVISIIPGVESPTADINTCLGLGLLVFIIVHFSAVKSKGILKYIKSYCEPFFIMFPLNVLSEFGKVISHSFRLFGNIFAGGIIIALVAPIAFKIGGIISIPKFITSPLVVGLLVFMHAFYGIFIGVIQAFVFAVLALTYIAVARGD